MKFLSEMMSKRKPSDETATPLDAPLEADGGGTGDFPLPDFAAVAGESLNPVAQVDSDDAMPSAKAETGAEAPRERFVQDEDSYDWDIGALDLSDDGDNPMETETGAEGAQPLAAAMGGQARPEEEMMDKYEMDQTGDSRETEMDDAVDTKARAAQALASFAADLGATTAPEASDDDEDEPAVAASLHAAAAEISGALGASEDADEDEDDEAEPALMAALSRLPDPKDAGTDMSWGDEDPGTPEAGHDDPWGEAPRAEAHAEDVMEMPEPEAPEMEAPEMDAPEMEAPEMDEPGMEAPEMEAPLAAMAKPDPWGEVPKTAGVSSLMAKTVQQKMSAMRAEAMARAASPETDEMDDGMMAPEEAAPVMPSRSAFMGDGIAGQTDDDETEVASLSPLAALRAQREAALAAAKTAEPVARAEPAPEAAPVAEATAPAMDAGGHDDEGYDDEGYDDEGYDDQAYGDVAYDDDAYDGRDEEASDDAAYEDDMSEGETMDADALDTWAPEEPVQRATRPAPVMEAPDAPAPAMPEAAQPMPMRPPLRSAEPVAQSQAAAEDDLPEAAPAPRRAGRVKTRLLGFHKADESADPIRAAEEGRATAPTFPVGWLIVVKGPGRGACFTLSAGASKIGRGEDQAVRLDFGDTSISRDNHAVVAYDDESKQFFIGHGGKANLVRLNDMPVLSTETLNDGDVIRIGETVLLFVALCSDAFSWTDGPFAESTHAAE